MNSEIAAQLQNAVELHRSGRYDDARTVYRRILDVTPNHPAALHLLGLCEHQQGRLAEALPLIERAIQHDSTQAAFFNSLGLVFKSLNRLDEAVRAYERAISIDPSLPEFHNNLGSVFLSQRRYAEAETALSRAIAIRPNHASAHNNLGLLHWTKGRFDQAIASYRRATEIAPQFAPAWRNLAGMYRRKGQLQQAAEAYEHSIRLAPDSMADYLDLADTFLHLNRRETAIDLLRQALKRNPESAEAPYFLAALGEGAAPPVAPQSYVTNLFDGYATDFDSHLRSSLNYKVPELMLESLQSAHVPERGLEVVDIGCGTGLCGQFLKPRASMLHGVDLSAEMLKKAESTNLYDELTQGDLVEVLAGRPDRYDLVVAGDVLNYFGDLTAPTVASREALRAGGHFVYSVEALQELDYRLNPSRRYCHGETYLHRISEQVGLQVVLQRSIVLRREEDLDVNGWLMVLRKPA